MEDSEEEVYKEEISDKQPTYEESKESNGYVEETVPTAHIEAEASQFQNEREPDKQIPSFRSTRRYVKASTFVEP